jgi:hypothetical protein
MCRVAAALLVSLGVFCTATHSPCAAQEALKLPEGVTHVALPPGALTMKRIFKNGKPLLRVSVGRTVIHARELFLGDGVGALKYEAVKEGIHHPRPGGRKGPVVGVESISDPGTTFIGGIGTYWGVEQLKAGSVYLTTPSIKFEFR